MEKQDFPLDSVCFKLGKVYRNVQRYYENNLQSFGLTPVQYFVIMNLYRHDGMKFKDLANALSIEGPTLTGLIDRMERAGFLERRGDPEDRRSVLVYLTDKGKLIGPKIHNLASQLDEKLKAQFSDQDFELFLDILDRIEVPEN
ncbi:MAG: MarR family transcriptional regulator [Syntrophomonadaceae bacterium]|nr:MarR family transcriptional regulator [Syntrophomonadaceae bacterium]